MGFIRRAFGRVKDILRGKRDIQNAKPPRTFLKKVKDYIAPPKNRGIPRFDRWGYRMGEVHCMGCGHAGSDGHRMARCPKCNDYRFHSAKRVGQ